MKLKKVLSQRIKTLREAAGLSQQDVATKGDLSLSLVAKLEQGKKADPRASTLLALAQALGVRPGQLLDDLFPPQPEPRSPGGTTVPSSLADGPVPEGVDLEPVNGQHHDGNGKKGKKKKEAKKKKKE